MQSSYPLGKCLLQKAIVLLVKSHKSELLHAELAYDILSYSQITSLYQALAWLPVTSAWLKQYMTYFHIS